MRVISRKKGGTDPAQDEIKRRHCSHSQGKLSVVGIGPGSLDLLTLRAEKAIRESQVIAGYKTYIELLGDLSKGKELISTGMTQEVERARQAIDKAKEGYWVCLVSSGDPGVYGMAGLVLELLRRPDYIVGGRSSDLRRSVGTVQERSAAIYRGEYLLKEDDKIKIEIIPGVMSSSGCAAILGAPLMHDFAVISLSDLLTDLKLIEKRIIAAVKADFVIALYNPKSKKRVEPFERACNILMRYRKPQTPVGIVRDCERPGQNVRIIRLKDLPKCQDIDMTTTLIIGNSQTYVKAGYMITPRGYRL